MPRLTTALMLCLSLMVAACNAQNSTGKADAAGKPKFPQFSEPAITAKIVDADTLQPIQGVMVYGFYATTAGGTQAGGSKFGQHVRSFETETDANGVFKLDAWDTGDRVISGWMGDRFPLIAFYKPGYDLWFDRDASIKQYRPKSGNPETEVSIVNGVRDWTKFPHRLKPLSTVSTQFKAELIERYRMAQLDDSLVIMMYDGPCGWEAYARTMLVQHNELKDWYARNYPKESQKTTDSPKVVAQKFPGLKMVSRSGVDELLEQFEKYKSVWPCRDPNQVFAGRK